MRFAQRVSQLSLIVAGAVFACVPAAAVLAQDGGEPVVVGIERKWEGIQFEPLHFALDFTARAERNTIDPQNGDVRHDKYNEFRETLTAWTSGFIGHPNLISFDLSGTFGLSQQFVDSDSENREEDPLETINEYDVSATVFGKSQTPFTAYSRRNESFLDRQFGDSIRSVVTEHGAYLLLLEKPLPTTLHYFHRTEDQTSEINPSDFNLVQDTLEWNTQWAPTSNQTFDWDYTIDRIEQSGDLRATNSFFRQNAIATYDVDFGDANEHNLRSTLFYYGETGDFPIDRLRLDESLRLRHSPDFETLYDYSAEWVERSDSEQWLQRGRAGLRHHLFDSLVTGADIGGSILKINPDNFTSEEVFGDVTFDYDKRVPLGKISAGLSFLGNLQDNSERGSSVQLSDQTFVFGTSGVITIERQNIEADSIRITDIAGIIVYSEGLDYTVRAFDDRVEIRRVLGGEITGGQAVLIDYRIGPEPANTTTTLAVAANLRYDIEETWLAGLGVYGRYLHQDQEVDSRDINAPLPADVDDLTLGIDYRLGYFFASAERQMHDSTLSPYDATRLSANYIHPLGLGTSLSFNANYDDIDRTDDGTNTTIMSVGGRWRQRINQQLTVNVGAQWRSEDDSFSGDVQAFEQVIDITWRHRQTTIFGAFRNTLNNATSEDSHFMSFEIGLRREF